MGDLAVVYLEADDLGAALNVIGTCGKPLRQLVRDHVRDVHGVSLGDGFPSPGSPCSWTQPMPEPGSGCPSPVGWRFTLSLWLLRRRGRRPFRLSAAIVSWPG